MELDANFTRAQDAVTTAELNLEMAKESYAMVCNSESEGKRPKGTKEKPYRPTLSP